MIDITADPPAPPPGTTANLTVTVSGARGLDRYAVSGVKISLVLESRPGADANLSPTSVTTDASGAATAQLKLSRTRGLHLVTASGAGRSASLRLDTLLGDLGPNTRSRHSYSVTAQGNTPLVDPRLLLVAAGTVMVLGFVFPYRRALLGTLAGAPRPASPPPSPRPVAPARPAPVSAPRPTTAPAVDPWAAAAVVGPPPARADSDDPWDKVRDVVGPRPLS